MAIEADEMSPVSFAPRDLSKPEHSRVRQELVDVVKTVVKARLYKLWDDDFGASEEGWAPMYDTLAEEMRKALEDPHAFFDTLFSTRSFNNDMVTLLSTPELGGLSTEESIVIVDNALTELHITRDQFSDRMHLFLRSANPRS